MARKNILSTSKLLNRMNPIRWYYEYMGLKLSDGMYVEKWGKKIISLLGLNVVPPKIDEKTGLLIDPDKDDYMPLTLFIAHPEILKGIFEKREDMLRQESMDADVENIVADIRELTAIEEKEFKEQENKLVPILSEEQIKKLSIKFND